MPETELREVLAVAAAKFRRHPLGISFTALTLIAIMPASLLLWNAFTEQPPACAWSVPADFALRYGRQQMRLRHFSEHDIAKLTFAGSVRDSSTPDWPSFYVGFEEETGGGHIHYFEADGNGCGLSDFLDQGYDIVRKVS